MRGSLSKGFLLILFLSVLVLPSVFSQDTDLKLIKQHSFNNPVYEKHQVRPFLKSNSQNILVKYNPFRLAFGGMMYLYQNVLSEQYSAQCMYNPSCSGYGKQLIFEYGLIPGVFYTADRIMRCNRLAEIDLREYQVDPGDHHIHESIDRYSRSK